MLNESRDAAVWDSGSSVGGAAVSINLRISGLMAGSSWLHVKLSWDKTQKHCRRANCLEAVQQICPKGDPIFFIVFLLKEKLLFKWY